MNTLQNILYLNLTNGSAKLPLVKNSNYDLPVLPANIQSPDYDNWGPDSYWSCGDWKRFAEQLVAAYGKEQALVVFGAYWDQQDSFEHAYNWCKYDGDFVAYFKSLGVTDDRNPFAKGWGIAGDAISTVGNTVEGAKNASGMVKYLIPVLVGLAAIGISYYGYLKIKKAA